MTVTAIELVANVSVPCTIGWENMMFKKDDIVEVVVDTHPIPQKYYSTHSKLGT